MTRDREEVQVRDRQSQSTVDYDQLLFEVQISKHIER